MAARPLRRLRRGYNARPVALSGSHISHALHPVRALRTAGSHQQEPFPAKAAPVQSPEEAQAFIQAVSDPTATHNCWAWKIGNQYRFSDDGEPGGTAGRPMLTAIEGQDFDRVAVVVIRWFGGIKLGTGGLARAYGGTTAKCLQAGERSELVSRSRCRCHCRFAELALLKARLGDFEALLEAEHFDAEGATLEIALPPLSCSRWADCLLISPAVVASWKRQTRACVAHKYCGSNCG